MSAAFIEILKTTIAEQRDSTLREMFRWMATAAQIAERCERLSSELKATKDDVDTLAKDLDLANTSRDALLEQLATTSAERDALSRQVTFLQGAVSDLKKNLAASTRVWPMPVCESPCPSDPRG